MGIHESAAAKTIDVAPPILSRVYNQLGNGIVNLNNARKITDFPIPFPFAQMVTMMLLVHFIVTAVMCAVSVSNLFWAGFLAFFVVFSFWSVNYIAVELEMPFGDDANDLPLQDMQEDFIKSLKTLMHPTAQATPKFQYMGFHQDLPSSYVEMNSVAVANMSCLRPTQEQRKTQGGARRQRITQAERKTMMTTRKKVLSMEYVEQSMESIVAAVKERAEGALHSAPSEGAGVGHTVTFGDKEVREAGSVSFIDVPWGAESSEPLAPIRYRSEVFGQGRNLLSSLHVLTPPDIILEPVAQPESEPSSNQKTASTEPKHRESDSDHHVGVLKETYSSLIHSTSELPWLDKFLHEHLAFERDILVLAGDMKDLLGRHLGQLEPVMEPVLSSPGRVKRVCKEPGGR